MSRITEAVGRLSPEDLKRIAGLLGCAAGSSESASAALAARLLTYDGLAAVLGDLDPREMQVLAAAADDENGATYSEMEKKLRLPADLIEEAAGALAKRLLAHILKNRQRIHNRMDRLIVFPEVRRLLASRDPAELAAGYGDMLARLATGSVPALPLPGDRASKKLLAAAAARGGIIPYNTVGSVVSGAAREKTIRDLAEKNIMEIFPVLASPFHLYCALSPEALAATLGDRSEDPGAGEPLLSNHCRFLLNMLHAYDVILSTGLFLTQQREFRKVDRKRIAEAMAPMTDIDGEPLDPDAAAQLALHCLHRLRCIALERDAARVSLKAIAGDLDSPARLIGKLLRNNEPRDDGGLFGTPLPIPGFAVAREALDLATRYGTRTPESLRALHLASLVARGKNTLRLADADEQRAAVRSFDESLRFLVLCGAISMSAGRATPTDIGHELAGRAARDATRGSSAAIYINPDFTLIIPHREIGTETLFHLLTHTELLKEDLMVHARISRTSIVRAHKRGMPPDRFLDALGALARNGIPQNLQFLITEWLGKTIHVRISRPVLVHSNQPTLLDELSYGKLKDAIVERIAPEYAIIRAQHLDDVVRFAGERDAVIGLFEEEDETVGGD
ncbi:MAG TPA: helicase-associated domain-containing protein [Spirochaetota bacterium]|nr:helicase-associated domain-containing protein [Spirochaetota bacterium]